MLEPLLRPILRRMPMMSTLTSLPLIISTIRESSALRFTVSLSAALYISLSGYAKKKSLNKSGAIAAFFTGFVNLFCSYRYGIILLAFYYSSSYLTRVGDQTKSRIELHHKKAGQRNYIQVFANSILATGLILLRYFSLWFFHNTDQSAIARSNLIFDLLFISHYACATADTWASEASICNSKLFNFFDS